ncbi:putative serine/threonine-protein kinase [Dirofilaria immitis]
MARSRILELPQIEFRGIIRIVIQMVNKTKGVVNKRKGAVKEAALPILSMKFLRLVLIDASDVNGTCTDT